MAHQASKDKLDERFACYVRLEEGPVTKLHEDGAEWRRTYRVLLTVTENICLLQTHNRFEAEKLFETLKSAFLMFMGEYLDEVIEGLGLKGSHNV